jgi:hypothetical protein
MGSVVKLEYFILTAFGIKHISLFWILLFVNEFDRCILPFTGTRKIHTGVGSWSVHP